MWGRYLFLSTRCKEKTADARLLGIIRLPEATANLGWGGPDWRTPFITASTSLYRVRLSVPGIPVGPEAPYA